jgi:hypothetical protein
METEMLFDFNLNSLLAILSEILGLKEIMGKSLGSVNPQTLLAGRKV